MSIDISHDKGGVTMRMEGEICGTTETIQEFKLLTSMIDENPAGITVAMRGVHFVDSLCLGLLVGLFLKTRESCIAFSFKNISKQVHDIFTTTNLDEIFPPLPQPD